MSLFASLENLNKVVEEAADLEAMSFDEIDEVMSLSLEAELLQADIDMSMTEFEALEDAFVSLEALNSVIAEHGICKSIMLAADPKGELHKYIDGLPAVESLDVVPINDANAVAATEAIKETLKKWYDAIIAWFKSIGEKIAKFFTLVKQLFMKNASILESLKKKVNAIDLPKDKKKVKLPSAAAMKTVQESVIKLIKALGGSDTTDPEDIKVPGVKVEGEGEKVRFVFDKEVFKAEEKTMGELGWGKSSIISAIDAAITVCKEMAGIDRIVKQLKKEESEAKKAASKADEASKADAQKAVKAAKFFVGGAKALDALSRRYVSTVISIGNAYSGKKADTVSSNDAPTAGEMP